MNVLEQIGGLVSSQMNVVKTIIQMFKLEARLAGLSVYPLLLNICAIFVVLMSTWFSCMLLTGYIFFVLLDNVVWSIGMVLFINIGLLLGLLKYLSFNLKKMSFEQTRKYFSQHDETADENLEKKVNC